MYLEYLVFRPPGLSRIARSYSAYPQDGDHQQGGILPLLRLCQLVFHRLVQIVKCGASLLTEQVGGRI